MFIFIDENVGNLKLFFKIIPPVLKKYHVCQLCKMPVLRYSQKTGWVYDFTKTRALNKTSICINLVPKCFLYLYALYSNVNL